MAGSGPSRRLRLVQWCHPICQVQQHDPCGAEHIGALRAAEEKLMPAAEASEDGGRVLELPSTWRPSRQSVEEWNARREEEFAALHDDEVAEERLFLGLAGPVLGAPGLVDKIDRWQSGIVSVLLPDDRIDVRSTRLDEVLIIRPAALRERELRPDAGLKAHEQQAYAFRWQVVERLEDVRMSVALPVGDATAGDPTPALICLSGAGECGLDIAAGIGLADVRL